MSTKTKKFIYFILFFCFCNSQMKIQEKSIIKEKAFQFITLTTIAISLFFYFKNKKNNIIQNPVTADVNFTNKTEVVVDGFDKTEVVVDGFDKTEKKVDGVDNTEEKVDGAVVNFINKTFKTLTEFAKKLNNNEEEEEEKEEEEEDNNPFIY